MAGRNHMRVCSIALRDVIKPKQLGILSNKSVEVKPVSIEPVLLMQRHYAKLHPFPVTSYTGKFPFKNIQKLSLNSFPLLASLGSRRQLQ